jgi:hypothetical protein
MKYSVGDLILWKSTEELSIITDYWLDYGNRVYYQIETYHYQLDQYRKEQIGEERINILINYGSIEYYPVR